MAAHRMCALRLARLVQHLTTAGFWLQGPANTPQNELFTFATYLYNSGARGAEQSASMFGPTIRVPANTNISLRLTNDLIGSDKVGGLSGSAAVLQCNLHLCMQNITVRCRLKGNGRTASISPPTQTSTCMVSLCSASLSPHCLMCCCLAFPASYEEELAACHRGMVVAVQASGSSLAFWRSLPAA